MSLMAARKAAQRAVPNMMKCEKCGTTDAKLNRHHTDYTNYTEVKVLCTKCHAAEHLKPKVTAECAVCGQVFVAKDHRSRAKICSRDCLAEYGRICARKRWDKTGE